MSQGSYKIIYRERGRRRGENYTGKVHSKKAALKLIAEHHKFEKRFKTGAKVKLVRARRKSSSQFGFGRMPSLRMPRLRF